MSYTQLTQKQRYVIYILNRRGETQSDIADEVGVNPSTICRELKRNRGQRGYRYKQAHRFALERREGKAKRRITDEDWAEVERLLKKQWSPEQISGRLEKEGSRKISHEWMYQYVWADKAAGGDLHEHLRCRSRYRKRYGGEDRRGALPGRTSIEERPEIVDEKTRIGDWESDTVLGKQHKGALLTTVERRTKFTVIGHLKRKTADGVQEEQIKQLLPYRERVLTITNDNGREFARHEEIAEELEAEIFFAHPYASWERGLNENTNGLVRQYFPKGQDLRNISEDEVQKAEDRLNHRPRKALNYQTPYEAFHQTEERLTVALGS